MLAHNFEASHPTSFPSTRQWTSFFSSEDTMSNYITSDQYPDSRGNILFGVVIHKWDPINAEFDYSLRFNSTDDDGTPRIKPYTFDFRITVDMANTRKYVTTGFLDWQLFIDQTICKCLLPPP
jgi:hypothetical protein